VERANALAPVHVLWGRALYLTTAPALVCDDDMTRHVTVDRIGKVSRAVARPVAFTINAIFYCPNASFEFWTSRLGMTGVLLDTRADYQAA
jgi:hypothetical protein